MRFLVKFRSRSSVILEEDSAKRALDRAEREFGSKVSRVEVVEPDDDEDEDLEDDEEEEDE